MACHVDTLDQNITSNYKHLDTHGNLDDSQHSTIHTYLPDPTPKYEYLPSAIPQCGWLSAQWKGDAQAHQMLCGEAR